jgi:hypothetical protein
MKLLPETTIYVLAAREVWRSSDGGQTWEPLADASTLLLNDELEVGSE